MTQEKGLSNLAERERENAFVMENAAIWDDPSYRITDVPEALSILTSRIKVFTIQCQINVHSRAQ